MNNDTYLNKTIDWIRSRGYAKIKSVHDAHEDPSPMTKTDDELQFRPTATAFKHGRKSFFQLVQKADDVRTIKSKWKLLSIMARIKGGQFFLIVPRGTKAYAERIIDSAQIKAHLVHI